MIAAAGGDGCAGLDAEDRSFDLFIVRADVAVIADMQMAGEEQINAEGFKDLQGARSAVDNRVGGGAFWRNEGVMGNQDFQCVKFGLREDSANLGELRCGDIAIFPEAVEGGGDGAGGVDAENEDFIIGVDGPEVVGDKFFVSAQGGGEAAKDVPEGDVVIAGDDELRGGKLLEEVGGLAVLANAGALGEVARADKHVEFMGVKIGEQGLGDCVIHAAEMQVRNVGDGAHENLQAAEFAEEDTAVGIEFAVGCFAEIHGGD